MVKLVIVFNSGVVVELDAEATNANLIIGEFYKGWDNSGVNLALNLGTDQGAIRIKSSDVSGMIIR